MDRPESIARRAQRLLEEAEKLPPKERFKAMVRSGLIDEDGKVLPWKELTCRKLAESNVESCSSGTTGPDSSCAGR